MNFLLLGIDSLIACIAIGPLVEKRRRVQLAALFGLADGLVFLIGAGLGWGLFSEATSEVVETGLLVGMALWLLLVAAGTRRLAASWTVWALPFALTVDNLAFGVAGEHGGTLLGQFAQQTISSALLAFAGILVGVALPRAVPAMRRGAATQVAGGVLLLGAGALTLIG
jgi:hypothetical protein